MFVEWQWWCKSSPVCISWLRFSFLFVYLFCRERQPEILTLFIGVQLKTDDEKKNNAVFICFFIYIFNSYSRLALLLVPPTPLREVCLIRQQLPYQVTDWINNINYGCCCLHHDADVLNYKFILFEYKLCLCMQTVSLSCHTTYPIRTGLVLIYLIQFISLGNI